MALVLTIGGVDKTSILQARSLNIMDEVNSRNTCNFELLDPTGAYDPPIGSIVQVTDGADTKFAGTIDETERSIPPGSDAVVVMGRCVDYNQLADRHVVARSYTQETLGDIVRDIVTNDLAGEGITTTGVQDGPTIEKAVFNYITVAEAFDELARITTFKWNIGYDKDLAFFDRESYTAPFALTDTSRNFREMKLRRTREEYRNRQWIRGGTTQTDPRTESFVGDGERRTFNLGFPVQEMNSIELNNVAQIVAVRGTPGAEWFYTKGETLITQADAGTTLTGSDTLEVNYVGEYPIIVRVEEDTEVEARKAVEGGTGVYGAVEYDENVESTDQGRQLGLSLLDLYAKIPRIVDFETDVDGLQAGQWLTINVSGYGLNDSFLIVSVQTRDVGGQMLRHRVSCVGSEKPSWVQFFQGLSRQNRRLVIRENEILVLVRTLTDTVQMPDTLTATTSTPATDSLVGSANVGFSEVA